MKHKLHITLACAITMASGSLLAQSGAGTSPTAGSTGASTTAGAQSGSASAQTMYENKVVNDAQGNRLGQIQRVINDRQSNQPRFAVIRTTNNREVAVPINAFNRSQVGVSDFTLNADASKLQAPPEFKEENMTQLQTREGSQQIYSHWGTSWDAPAATTDAATMNTGTSTSGGRQSTGTGVSGNTNTGTGAPGGSATSAGSTSGGTDASNMAPTSGSRQSTGTGASGSTNNSSGQSGQGTAGQ